MDNLKVLLSIDGNNYKITIKTKNRTNAVPFSEFKYFLDDKHRQLFNDAQYIWKIYDADFGEYLTLEESSLIQNLSKLSAVKVSNENRPTVPAPKSNLDVEPMQIDRDPQPFNGNDRARQLYGQENVTNYNLQDNFMPTGIIPPQRVERFDSMPAGIVSAQRNDPYETIPRGILSGQRDDRFERDELDLRKFVTANPQDRELLYSQQLQQASQSFSGDPYSRGSGLNSYLGGSLSRSDTYPQANSYGRGDSYSRSNAYPRMDSYGRGDSYNDRNKDPFPLVLPLNRLSAGGSSNYPLSPPSPLYQTRLSAPLESDYNRYNSMGSRAYPTSLLPYSDYSDSRNRDYHSSPATGFTGSITKRASNQSYNNRNRVLTSQRTSRVRSPERNPGDIKILQRAINDTRKPRRVSPVRVSAASQGFRFFLKLENIPQKRDLLRAVEKYNDEFETIASIENLWETNKIWNYVAKEMGTKKQVVLLRDCRKMFKDLLDQYKKILNNPREWNSCKSDIWPFFETFHKRLNLKPFDKNIEALKKSFDTETKKIKGISVTPTKPANKSATTVSSSTSIKKKVEATSTSTAKKATSTTSVTAATTCTGTSP